MHDEFGHCMLQEYLALLFSSCSSRTHSTHQQSVAGFSLTVFSHSLVLCHSCLRYDPNQNSLDA
jgi:hypothetical protein